MICAAANVSYFDLVLSKVVNLDEIFVLLVYWIFVAQLTVSVRASYVKFTRICQNNCVQKRACNFFNLGTDQIIGLLDTA